MDKVPPIQTLAEEQTLWTLIHTAGLTRPAVAVASSRRFGLDTVP